MVGAVPKKMQFFMAPKTKSKSKEVILGVLEGFGPHFFSGDRQGCTPRAPTWVPWWEIPFFKPYMLLVFMCFFHPQESLENTINKYHGYTVRGTPNCPLIFDGLCASLNIEFNISGDKAVDFTKDDSWLICGWQCVFMFFPLLNLKSLFPIGSIWLTHLPAYMNRVFFEW